MVEKQHNSCLAINNLISKLLIANDLIISFEEKIREGQLELFQH